MSGTTDLARGPGASEWQGHRLAAAVVRVIVFLCPLSAAVAAGLVVSRSIPSDTAWGFAFRVVLAAVASVCSFLLVERGARRFLPLAVLLRLNLVFPDRAPSRFSVALRSTSVRKLEQRVRDARRSDDAAVLAEKIITLASALNTHDRRTRGHCERTRALADLITEELHLAPTEVNEVRWGAFLHDIGKLSVPTEILNKPGKPTSQEWEILRRHPESGARLVAPLRTFLNSGVDAVGSHHENFDGTGYPNGLSGEQLPLAARIVAVADSFEVMTAVRAYKRPMTMQGARTELARGSGTQFDPLVVRAFLNVSLGRLHWVLGIAAWAAELPFLTIVPRLAAQVSTAVGGGSATVPPVALPSIAAASLGALAVMGHVGDAGPRPAIATAEVARPTAVSTPSVSAPSAPVSAAPVPSASPLPVAGPSLVSGASSLATERAGVEVPQLPEVGVVDNGPLILVGPGTSPLGRAGAFSAPIDLPPVVAPLVDSVAATADSVAAGAVGDDPAPDTTTQPLRGVVRVETRTVDGAETIAGALLGGPGPSGPPTS